MLNSVSSNYGAVEDGTGTAAFAEPPRKSWGRILAATLACVALATIAFSGAVQLRSQATVTAFPDYPGTVNAQCRDSDPRCDSGLYCADPGSVRCLDLHLGPCTCTGGTSVAGNVCKSGEQKCKSCRSGYKLHSDSCQYCGLKSHCKSDEDCCEGGLSCLQQDILSSPECIDPGDE